jgi:hypothetical protein
VRLGIELFVLPFTEAVAATKTVADAQKNILATQLKEVGTPSLLMNEFPLYMPSSRRVG